MTKRENLMFRIAKDISYLSDYKGARLGAVVAQGKRVLSTGHNAMKTRPLQQHYNFYRDFRLDWQTAARQHAEIDALSPLIGKPIDWARTEIYVYRELRDGTVACSKPCPACARLMHDLGIKTVYYINQYGEYTKEKIL